MSWAEFFHAMKSRISIRRTTCLKTIVRRSKTACTLLLPLLLLLMLPAAVQAQFSYVTNNDGTITITEGCRSGALTIPATINGRSVTSIGGEAFAWCSRSPASGTTRFIPAPA